MQFPGDENGNVLRHMAASGFDFGRVHDVDFYAVFPAKEDAALVARQLLEADRSIHSRASVTTDIHQDGTTQLKIVQTMLVTHDNISKFERYLGQVCAKHGGALDGWGVMQESAPDVPGAASRPGEAGSRLNAPLAELDDAERNFVEGIKAHGWMQTHALDEVDKPGFCFTTGFDASIGHPEILVFKIDEKVANEIFWVLYRCAQNGTPVPIASRTGGILPNDDAYVFRVARRHYANFLGWSRWFYRGDDFECLQIVWPDEAGLFPWEDGFDSKYAKAQIDLTDRGWAAEAAT